MTNDEVKEYLRQVRKLEKAIRIKENTIRRLRELEESITVAPTPDVVQGGKMNNKSFADNTIARMSLEGELHGQRLKYIEGLADITQRIDNMGKERLDLANVLSAYYVNCMTWEQVCVELEMSWTEVVGRLHPEALKKFRDFL